MLGDFYGDALGVETPGCGESLEGVPAAESEHNGEMHPTRLRNATVRLISIACRCHPAMTATARRPILPTGASPAPLVGCHPSARARCDLIVLSPASTPMTEMASRSHWGRAPPTVATPPRWYRSSKSTLAVVEVNVGCVTPEFSVDTGHDNKAHLAQVNHQAVRCPFASAMRTRAGQPDGFTVAMQQALHRGACNSRSRRREIVVEPVPAQTEYAPCFRDRRLLGLGACPRNPEPTAHVPQRHLLAIAQLPWHPPCSFHDRQRDRRERTGTARSAGPPGSATGMLRSARAPAPKGEARRMSRENGLAVRRARDGTGISDRLLALDRELDAPTRHASLNRLIRGYKDGVQAVAARLGRRAHVPAPYSVADAQ